MLQKKTSVQVAELKKELASFNESTTSFFVLCKLDDKTKKTYIDTLNKFNSANEEQLNKFIEERKKAQLDYVYKNLSIVYNWFRSPELFKGMPIEVANALKSGIVLSFKRVVPLVKELYTLAE